MKKLIYLIAIALLVPVLSGCEGFLDTKNYTTKDTNSFPINENDANMMLNGVYVMLNVSHAQAINSWFFIAEMVSDDRFGGGGINDREGQAIAHLMFKDPDQFNTFWADRYAGTSRATQTIDALDLLEDGPFKNQKVGEAKFLRAHWFFELVQMFGDIPLPDFVPQSAKDVEIPPVQKPQKEVFASIATDLWDAYSTMPADKAGTLPSGTITKWAAGSLLARVFLFYTGFYGEAALPMKEGAISKEQVITVLEAIINNSGHDLLKDFRSLWPYTNKLTKKDYAFAADAPDWVEGNANKEVIFSIKMNPMASGWGAETTVGYSNSMSLFFAPRIPGGRKSQESIFPMGSGWGMGPVNPKLWNEWPATDPRRKASIYNQAEEATAPGYEWGQDKQVEETGMWQKKVVATTAFGKKGDPKALYNSFWSDPAYGTIATDDPQMGHGSDLILIRFADVLLMHSELKQDATGMNRVRKRAGLGEIAYSAAALRNERHYELAFEGLRWGDIRRWKIAPDALNAIYGAPISNGVKIVNEKPDSYQPEWTTMKPHGSGMKARYEATNGFFYIPQTQIDLSEGTLAQNAGWGGADANYVGY
jgi:hypothetical protein